MRKMLGILLFAGLVLVLADRATAQEADEARAIVNKAIKAMGGEDKLKKLATMTWKETGTYHGMGSPLPYVGNYAANFPDKFRMEIEGAFVLIFAGDKGWTKMGDEVKEMGKVELATQKNDHQAGWIASLVPLADKAFSLKSLGESKAGEQVLVGVQVNRKDYPEVKLYFDKKTSLLAKSVFPTKAQEEMYKDVKMEMSFSDYKEVGGGMLAHKMLLKRDGKVFVEAVLSDCKPVEKLDPALFEKPK